MKTNKKDHKLVAGCNHKPVCKTCGGSGVKSSPDDIGGEICTNGPCPDCQKPEAEKFTKNINLHLRIVALENENGRYFEQIIKLQNELSDLKKSIKG